MTKSTDLHQASLQERWRRVLESRGDAPAVRAATGETLRTFGDVEAEAVAFGERLQRFPAGSVIAIQSGNHRSWPALLLACVRLGLVPLPMGGVMENGERAAVLGTCGVAGLVEAAGDGISVIPVAARSFASIPGAPEFLKLTSGTTAAPRAIRFQIQQLIADCDNICETMGITSDDLNFGVIPFSHSYGFSNLITPLLCRGVALVASEDRLPRAILWGLHDTEATVFPGMPIFYQALAGMEDIPPLPALRLCISAGAPLLKSVGQSFTKKYRLKVHSFYGASECGGIAYDGCDSFEYEDNLAGQPMRNVSVTRLEHCSSSQIVVESAAVGDGYFPKEVLNVLGDGRFIPGDLVQIGERGMSLAGRVSDIINVAGRKLNPLEVEARLAEFPGVKQVVVFGVPSSLRNEEPVACIAANGALAAGDLLRFSQGVLSAWQVPRDIWLVDEIPCNDRGKISRRELARLYGEKRRRG